MKQCQKCGGILSNDKEYCYCGCQKFITLESHHFMYHDKTYTPKEWYMYAANNIVVVKEPKDHIDIKVRHESLLPFILNYYINKNIRYATRVCYTLPCLLFLILGLISIILGSVNPPFLALGIQEKITLIFFGIMFLLLGLLIIYLALVKGQKKIYMKAYGQKAFVTLKQSDQMTLQIYFNEMIRLQNDGVFFTPLYSYRLGIREFKAKDADLLMKITGEEGFCTYLAMEPLSLEDSQAYIKKHQAFYKEKKIYRLALINETDECIGFIGLSTHNESAKGCEIVYGLSQSYAHKGMMTEAVKLFTHHLICFGKKCIIASHCKDNIRSGRVLLKSGFVRDNHYDTHMLIHGVDTEIIGYHYEK